MSFQDLLLKRQVGGQPAQAGILLFQVLHPPGLLKIKPAIFLAQRFYILNQSAGRTLADGKPQP